MRTVLVMLAVACCGAGAATSQPASRPAPKRVAFIVDFSGSLGKQHPAARDEVGRAIMGLKPDQAFALIVSHDGTRHQFEKGLMTPATDARKQSAWTFLAQFAEPRGPDFLDEAVPMVVKVRPDVVWIISDGELSTAEPLASSLKVASMGGKRFRVNTTAKFAVGPDYAEYLRTLAESNGGICIGRDGAAASPPAPPKTPEVPKGPSILQE